MKVIYLSFLLLVLQIYFSHGNVEEEKSGFGKLFAGGKKLYGGMKKAGGKIKGKFRGRKGMFCNLSL